MINMEKHLRNYILKECLTGEDPEMLANDDDLVKTGILDSLAVMKLVDHLEKTFKIQIPSKDISPENFGSIQQLTRFVSKKTSIES